MTRFSPRFEELRQQVDAVLLEFLAERRSELSESEILFDEIARMVGAGGKRIRPLFAYWGYRSSGRTHDDAIVTAGAALELLHTFALIHDDVMDGAVQRRGQPTVHSAHDIATAILAGDLALVLADDLLTSAGFDHDAARAAFEVYSRMRREVIAGQFLDVHTAADHVDEATARRIAVLKSGRYSVMEPLLVGAALAGASPELRGTLARFGEPLGEAFQLKDDVLGIFGDPALTGKPVDSDIREGKRNLLFVKTVAALDGEDLAFFEDRWGASDISDGDLTRIRELIEVSGAKRTVEELVDSLRLDAEDSLGPPIDPEAEGALRELVAVVVARDY